MKSLALLLDIGSTFTKALVCDMDSAKIVARTQGRTTAREDVMIGVLEAMSMLEEQGFPADLDSSLYRERYATSSAAGGLRMVVIGLTRGLTARAAREAATGAGARVSGVFAGNIGRREVLEMVRLRPDIILFTGGIDGGNVDHVLNNARFLADMPARAPVVVACNRKASGRAAEILALGGFEVHLSENVMPGLDGLDVTPAREIIREVFMRHIVKAKGLGVLSSHLDMDVMPTPYAVMLAVEVLGQTEEAMAVDVGGATTDVYSHSFGHPCEDDLIPRGLSDPVLRRTVEGDLGVREGVRSLLDVSRLSVLRGVREIASDFGRDDLDEAICLREVQTDYIPRDSLGERVEMELARACVDAATRRHAGVVETEDSPAGPVRYLRGKDLRRVKVLVGTGGAFLAAHRRGDSADLLEAALYSNDESTRPLDPKMMVDPGYAMFAAGLLSLRHVEVSRGLLGELESVNVRDCEDGKGATRG